MVLAVLAIALTFSSPSQAPDLLADTGPTPEFGEAPLSDATLIAELTSETSPSEYPVYRHSVVPGGVHKVDDVRRAVSTDPVVREHYGKVSVEKLKVVAAPARRDAYMSYRIGDGVYWTKKKIALAAGEALLTDGETTIRARCGNLVADEAMGPTSDQEPPASAFDAVEPRPDALPVASSEDLTALAGDLLARSGLGTASAFPGLAPGTFNDNTSGGRQGLGGFSSGNVGGSAGPGGGRSGGRSGGPGGSSDSALTDDSPGGGNPGGGPGGGNPGGGNPGDGNPGGGGNPGGDHPGDGNPGGGGNPGGDNPGGGGPGDHNPPWFEEPPGFPPTDFNPPGFGGEPTPGGPGNPGGPDVPPGFGPENPPITINQTPEIVPVPEPASLLLFGSGLAITAWRARRHQARSKKLQD